MAKKSTNAACSLNELNDLGVLKLKIEIRRIFFLQSQRSGYGDPLAGRRRMTFDGRERQRSAAEAIAKGTMEGVAA